MDNPKGTKTLPAFIRSMHPYAFHSGEWGQIIGKSPMDGCYLVMFPDGSSDRWVPDDPDGQYEFADKAPS